MAKQFRLRDACQRANEKAALSALSKSKSNPADPLFIYSDDGNSTILHYICAGQPVGALSRILLGWPEGIRPAPAAKERSALLSSLLNLYPEILQLACLQNQNRGLTPVHLCVQSASIEVLRVLVITAQKYFGREHAALLLSVPDSLGRTALCIALASQQWEAVELLLDTAALSHAGIQASYRINQALGGTCGGGGAGGGNSNRRTRRSTISSISFVPAGSSAGAVITGAVGGVFNKLWDAWGGSHEANLIEKHKSEVYLLGGNNGTEGTVSSSATSSGSSGFDGKNSAKCFVGDGTTGKSSGCTTTNNNNYLDIIDSKALKDFDMNSPGTAKSNGEHSNSQICLPSASTYSTSISTSTTPTTTTISSKLPSVTVLGDLSAVRQRQQNQIDRVAGLLNISLSESMQLLMKNNWDEAAALSSSASTLVSSNRQKQRFGDKQQQQRQEEEVGKEEVGKDLKEENDALEGDTIENIEDVNMSDGFQSAEEEEDREEQERRNEKQTRTCMVCFEDIEVSTSTSITNNKEVSLSRVSRYLPCSQYHFTCDVCWQGILKSNPQSACCPSSSCRLPLPLKAAEMILSKAKFERVSQLVAEKYVQNAYDLRWCPSVGCSMCLQLPRSGESGKIAGAAVAAGRGVDAFCTVCSYSSCWSCGEGSHEPASCSQARAWQEELAALRALAPVSDHRWLTKHAKQCPGCSAFIQRTGGCNHMTCQCGKHWCWECGRDWSEHNADTGGFYFCSLVENEEENEQESDQHQVTGTATASNNNNNNSSASSSSSWLRDIWKSVHNVAGEATLHRCLQMQLRHECDDAAVRAVAAYLQDISTKIGSSLSSERCEKILSTSRGEFTNTKILLGPEQIGVSSREAAEMRAPEWATVMATACHSAAENGAFNPKNSAKDAILTKDHQKKNKAMKDPAAALPVASSTETNNRSTIIKNTTRNKTTNEIKLDFPALASLIIEAHATLKNAAASLRALSGGARRKYLVELCEEAERSLALFEPVLMDAPYQTEAIEVGRGLLVLSTSPASGAPVQRTSPAQQNQTQPQQQRGFRGALSSFIQNIKGVPGLNYECRIPGIPAHVVVEQAHYVAAVQRQAKDMNIDQHMVALQKAINGLKDAGRKGLFS